MHGLGRYAAAGDSLPAVIGAFAGFFVVPMNALLQHRGYSLITPGRSIAVQGFNENLSVLLMLAVCAALVAAEVPLNFLLWLLGLTVAAAMALLIANHNRFSRDQR